MADETLVIDLQADTSGLQPTIDLLQKLGQIDEKTASQFRKANADIQAQQKALQGASAEFKKTGESADKASKQISSASKEANNGLTDLSSTIKNIGATIGIALGAEALIHFGTTAVDEFAKAEKAAFQLLGALNGNEVAQRRLLDVAQEFEGKFAIDRDVIVQQEAFLALQRRSEAQIKKTIEAAIQLTAAIGGSFEENVQKLDRTFQGSTKGIGTLDTELNHLSSTQLANGAAVDIVLEKYKGFAEKGLEGVNGKLERQRIRVQELTKQLGEKLAPVLLDIKEKFLSAFTLPPEIQKALDEIGERQKKRQEQLNSLTVEGLEAEKARLEEVRAGLLKRLDTEQNINKANIIRQQLSSGGIRKEINEIDKLIEAKKNVIAIDEEDFETLEKLQAKLVELNNDLAKVKNPLTTGKVDRDRIVADIKETQDKIDAITGKSAAKQLELLQKNAEERRKAQEALRKQALEEALKNVDAVETAQKLIAANTIKDAEDLQGRLTIIEFTALKERQLIKKAFGEDTIEEDKKLADLLIANSQKVTKEIQDSLDKELEARLKNIKLVRESIDDLSKFESDLSRKTLSELLAIIKVGKEVGVKGADDVKAAQEEIAKRATVILENIASIGQEVAGIFSALDEQQLQTIEDRRTALEDSFDKESQALQTKLDRDIITQAAYENQLKALRDKKAADEKRLDAEAKKIKQQQAEREKAFNIFQTILNTSAAIIKMLADPGGVQGVVLSAFAGVTGLLQLAKIVSTPTPKFHSGRLAKADSSEEHAIIRKDETILSPENSREYKEVLSAIHHRRIAPSFLNNIARMKIESMPQPQARDSIKFPSMLDEYGMSRVAKKGFKVSNPEDIAAAMITMISKENPYHKI